RSRARLSPDAHRTSHRRPWPRSPPRRGRTGSRARAPRVRSLRAMTVDVATLVLALALGMLAVLSAPHAAGLLRAGAPPQRPRRFWLTLLVTRELGAAVAAAAAAWIALATAALPAWKAAALAGGAAYLVGELVAPALGLLVSDAMAAR